MPEAPASSTEVFRYKLDIYVQAIAIYAAALVVYAVALALAHASVRAVLDDQVVYVLALCTAAATAGLVAGAVAGRRIEIAADRLVFASRFHRREIPVADIVWVRIGREKRVKVRGAYRVAKLKLRTRRKLVRLRPSLWQSEERLVDALRRLDVQVHRAPAAHPE